MLDEVRDAPTHTVDDVLLQMEAFGQQHDARETEHARKMRNLDRPTAQLMDILVRSSDRKRVLEIGTSNGYSTLWLARAVKANAGLPLVTVERDPAKHAAASANITRAGLDVWVQQHLGEASEIVGKLPGTYDCVFFDADRISAPAHLQLLMPQLESDVLLLSDNALSHPTELAAYRELCERLPGFTTMVVPIGKGLHIAYRSDKPVVNSWNQTRP